MKKLIIIILLGLLGCGPESNEEKKYDYSVVNNSGVTVEIRPLVNGVKEINNKITLENGKVLNKKLTDHAPYGGFSMGSLFTTTGCCLKQIKIKYNNSKKVIYTPCNETFNCNTQPRNIFGSEFNNEQTEIYTITADDYQNAIDCGGNCN